MGTPGAPISGSISVESSSVRSVAQRIVLAMTQTGEYQLVMTDKGVLVFSRSYKPSWGLGVISRSENCTMTITKGPVVVVVHIEGNILDDRREAVRAAVSGRSIAKAALDSMLGPVEVFPTLERIVERDLDDMSQQKREPVRRSSQQRAGRTGPVQPKPPQTSDPGPILPNPGNLPARPHVAGGMASSTPAATFNLDLGDRGLVPLDGRIVLGRDPVATDGVPARTVALRDSTVSKTHCWLEPSEGGVLICDLQSTNGTAVIDDHGRRVAVDQNAPTFVAGGRTIALGDCLLHIVGASGSRRRIT